MSDKLTALLERVTAATGPDRLLDGDLAEAFGLIPDGSLGDDNLSRWIPTEHGNRVFEAWSAPKLTASVDAALEAVEMKLPEWWLVKGGEARTPIICLGDKHNPTGRWHASLQHRDGGWKTTERARSLPLAILAALLAAILSKDPS